MKFRNPFIATVAALGLGAALSAAPANAPQNSRVEVNFFEPANFTDFKDSDFGTYERTTYVEQLRDHLQERAQNAIPPGYSLKVTFTNIDMAGEFEPWRGARFSDIRIVKDIYPPRVKLSFQLLDEEGNVVKQGERELSDMAFMMNLNTGFRNDPLRHEKALLNDWLRTEFQRPRKNS